MKKSTLIIIILCCLIIYLLFLLTKKRYLAFTITKDPNTLITVITEDLPALLEAIRKNKDNPDNWVFYKIKENGTLEFISDEDIKEIGDKTNGKTIPNNTNNP